MIKPAATKPSPVLVLFPGMGSFMGTSGETDAIDLAGRLDFIITQLSYTIILPYWSGAFERFDGGPFPQGEGINAGSLWMERTRHWVQEASQAITFAEEHAETDGERVGFLGISYGANNSIPVLALENRFRTALLFSGNLMSHPMFPFADSLNYYPRVSLPTLFINGRYDTIVSANEALFERRMVWLGTPAEHKKQVLYDAGHWPFPQHLFKKEVADWLKIYL
jgi:pimeloyl-ACP methyl ester carboxylesterase